jgi:hypothetical protein
MSVRSHITEELMGRMAKKGVFASEEPTGVSLDKGEESVLPVGDELFVEYKPKEGWIRFSELLKKAGIKAKKPAGQPDPYVMAPWNDSDWPEEDRKYIPSKEKVKERIVNWAVDSKIAEALSMNAKPIITSPPGAGKTSGVEWWCAVMRWPFVRFNMNGSIEPDAILGKMLVNKEGTYWQDGLYPVALTRGYVIVEDEWTKAPSFINMATQWLREEGGCLRLYDKPTDQVVVPHERARMVYTDNTLGLGDGMDKFSASNIQDTSTINRHGYFIHADYLPEDDEVRLLKVWFGDGITEKFSRKLVKLGNLIRKGYAVGEITLAWSPRTLKAVASLSLAHQDSWYGIENAFVNALASEDERNAVKAIYSQVF